MSESDNTTPNNKNDWVKVRYRVGDKELEVEGTNEFVEQHRSYFFQKVVGRNEEAAQVIEVSASSDDTKEKLITEVIVNTTTALLSLINFFLEKSPQRQSDEILVIAYYYHHYRNQEHLSLEDFDKAYDELKRAGVDKPANMKSSVRNVVDRTKYMYNPERGLFQLTIQGEKYVEEYDSNASAE